MSKKLTSDAEQRLIGDILHGHSEAFKALMDGYGDYVMRIVERMIPLEPEAQEVVQDVFIGAYRTLKSYDFEKASFATWLTRIAYHKIADHLKQKGKAMLYIEEHESLIDRVTDEMADSVLNDSTPRRIEYLRQAIRRIPPDDQTLLHLYYIDDRPLKEIAYIIDRPSSYLATRLQRIRKKLYIMIKDMDQHDNR